LSSHITSHQPPDRRLPPGGRWRGLESPAVAGVLVALFCGLVYANSLHNPFVYDDLVVVVENRGIVDVRDVRAIVLSAVTRPLTSFSYAVDRAIWGLDPFGFHVTNVLLHMINVFLVFCVAYRLTRDARPAGDPINPSAGRPEPQVVAVTTAVLFGVHPMLTQAVGYISGRSELLCATFGLIAFLAARRWMRGHGEYWWGIAVAWWMLALAAKEVAIVLPLMLIAYDRLVLPGDRRSRARRWSLHLPFLALTIVAVVIRAWLLLVIEYPQDGPDWRAAFVELVIVGRYLVLFVVPHGQTIFHSTSAVSGALNLQVGLAVGAAAGLSAFAWWVHRFDRAITIGIVWFGLLLVPSSLLLVFVRGEPMAEHRVYFASVGILLAAGSAAGWLVAAVPRPRARLLVYASLGAVVFLLSARTWQRNVVWSDPVVLWTEAVSAAPDHALPRLHLAEELRKTGHCDQAVAEYRRSIALRPKVRFAYGGLGVCLLTLRRFAEAAQAFTTFRDLDRTSADGALGLRLVANLQDGSQDARKDVTEALAVDPFNILARQLLTVLGPP
jgi:hypothetical protein